MRHGNPDANQAVIVEALRKVGAIVCIMTNIGDGAPDLLVGWRGETTLLEVKTEDGKLAVEQLRWHAVWRGRGGRLAVVRSPLDALIAIGAVRTSAAGRLRP